MLGCFLQETRSAHACAVQTRIRRVHFSVFLSKMCFFTAPDPFFSAPELCAPEFLTKRYPLTPVQSNHASAHPMFSVFIEPSSLKCIGLLRLGSALLHLSHALLISTRKAIRSRLCGPNTLLPLPFVSDCCPNALPCLAQALLCCPLALLCRAKSLLCLVQALPCLPRALLRCAQTLPCLAEALPCCAQGVLCCPKVLLCFAQALLC